MSTSAKLPLAQWGVLARGVLAITFVIHASFVILESSGVDGLREGWWDVLRTVNALAAIFSAFAWALAAFQRRRGERSSRS